jgi:tetratricopeptide (TPR) repeat protein
VAEREVPDQVSRILIEKRCEIYSQVAALLMDLDEAVDEDDGVRARYLLQDVRRTLRTALAFLTADVYGELERFEALMDLLPTREGAGLPSEAAAELHDRAQLLHVKLARSLTLPALQDLEQIVGLPQRLKLRLNEESRGLEVQAKRRQLEGECWQYEAAAREEIGKKNYTRAIKSLRQAIKLDPERAVFRNDLGVVLSLVGKHEEAVREYRAAVELNERYADRRTEEWMTSYYNLGSALRKRSQELFERGDAASAADLLRQAREAFEEYTRLSAAGPKVHDARGLVERLSQQLSDLAAAAVKSEETTS